MTDSIYVSYGMQVYIVLITKNRVCLSSVSVYTLPQKLEGKIGSNISYNLINIDFIFMYFVAYINIYNMDLKNSWKFNFKI